MRGEGPARGPAVQAAKLARFWSDRERCDRASAGITLRPASLRGIKHAQLRMRAKKRWREESIDRCDPADLQRLRLEVPNADALRWHCPYIKEHQGRSDTTGLVSS